MGVKSWYRTNKDGKKYKVTHITPDPEPSSSGSSGGSKKKSDWRKSARKTQKNLIGLGKGVLSLLILVMLFRFVIFKDFGWSMDFFVPYPDGSGLYYFDFFGWLKNCGVLFSNLKGVVNSLLNGFNGLIVSDDWLSSFINFLILPINIVLMVLKVIFCIPVIIIGVFFGGPFGQWSLEGGWIYNFVNFSIPYVDLNIDWQAAGDWIGNAPPIGPV